MADEGVANKVPKVINQLSSAIRFFDHSPSNPTNPQHEVKPSFSAVMRTRALKRELNEAKGNDIQSKCPRGDQSHSVSSANFSPVSGRPPESG